MISRANAAGARLAKGLRDGGHDLLYAQDANMIFAQFSRAQHQHMLSNGAAYYLWPHTAELDGPGDETVACRLVCNWATSEADVDQFLELVANT